MSESAKAYLRQIRTEQREIRLLMEHRDALCYSLYGRAIRYDVDKVAASPDDVFSERLAKICDMDDAIVDHVARMDARKANAMRIIGQIDDVNCRMILELYYLSVKEDGRLYSWEDVAREVSFAEKYILRALHPRALMEFERIRKEVT